MAKGQSFPLGFALRSVSTVFVLALVTHAVPHPLNAQARGSGVDEGARPMASGVLGGVPMTAADSMVAVIVDRLPFDSYKDLIRGLADFGDREQGTERNVQANDWIEEQLRSWGHETERHDYEFQGEPRQQVYATKVGRSIPEETGLNGARAYVADRASLQGEEDPPGSGLYPEPLWIGKIQHDKVLFDHGLPMHHEQAHNADVDVEFQLASERWEEFAPLALELINASRLFATDYPAVMSSGMANTDSAPFMGLTAAVSVRENRRRYEIGRGSDPHWHQATDLFVTYSGADFRLGFNAMQTTLGATARLVEARVLDRP